MVDQIAALITQARQYTEPLKPEPPSPSLLERFLDFTEKSLHELFSIVKKPNIRERFAELMASCGGLAGDVIIGLGIAGIVLAVISVKGAIALFVAGAMLIGVLLVAYVVKNEGEIKKCQ